MNVTEMHLGIELGVDKLDTDQVVNVEPEEKDYYLNKAQDMFKKQRYGGNNPHRTGFEQTQKRIDDLRTIVVRHRDGVKPFTYEDDVYTFDVPQNYDYLTNLRIFACKAVCGNDFIDTSRYLGTLSKKVKSPAEGKNYTPTKKLATPSVGVAPSLEEAGVDFENNQIEDGKVFMGNLRGIFTGNFSDPSKVNNITCSWTSGKEVQHDDISELKKDPFNKPDFEEVLYLFEGDQIYFYANPDFVITWVEITYLRKLARLSITLPTPTDYVYTCELPEHTHSEIVDMAVDLIKIDMVSKEMDSEKILVKQE